MAKISTNEFKLGLKLIVDGSPCAVLANEFNKPGKGQAVNRVKFRNLKTGRILDKTYRSGESLLLADVIEADMQYLYSDGESWHFMHSKTFEQYSINQVAMAGVEVWLKGEEICRVTLWDGAPLVVEPPNFVILKVLETDPGVKGDTATGGVKPAKLETGVMVKVPLFIDEGGEIRIDTRTGEYVSRSK